MQPRRPAAGVPVPDRLRVRVMVLRGRVMVLWVQPGVPVPRLVGGFLAFLPLAGGQGGAQAQAPKACAVRQVPRLSPAALLLRALQLAYYA